MKREEKEKEEYLRFGDVQCDRVELNGCDQDWTMEILFLRRFGDLKFHLGIQRLEN